MAVIREKRTKSGPLLEVDFFPVWPNGNKLPTRAPKSQPSVEAQRKYNETCAKKKIIRLVNENFKKRLDYYLHPTYQPSKMPQSEDRARRDINNFLRRVKRKREAKLREAQKKLTKAKSELLLAPDSSILQSAVNDLKKEIRLLKRPFKYIYSIEKETYQRGRYAGRDNWHFHMFVTGGLTQDEMEDLWSFGTTRCATFRPDKFGPESAALYTVKDPQGRKRFAYSRNIKQPASKMRDGTTTPRSVERMAVERIDDREFWEHRYKGYRFIRSYPRYNSYNKHWYVSVVMIREGEELPEWKEDDWNTEIGAV